jgi:dUTPase
MRAYIKTDPEHQTINRPYYSGDVGYDLLAASEPTVVGDRKTPKSPLFSSISYIEYDTNVSVAPEDESIFYSLVYPRSSLSKYNLALANSVGVVDSGYRDTIKLRFKYIIQPEDLTIANDTTHLYVKINQSKIYQKGDKIGQLVWMAHNKPYVEFTETLPASERGVSSFGSTGR